MTHELWSAVDALIGDRLVDADRALSDALSASKEAGLPPINVAPPQGKFLHLLARAIGAQRVLEIGTLGGYSTIWLARAVAPNGSVVTLEADPHHAEVARGNLANAGLADVVDVRVGPAPQTLPEMEGEGADPFDMSFIDADKQSNADYVAWALRLSRPGSVIVVDNVVRNGAVLDDSGDDPSVVGVRRCFDLVAAEPRLSATAIQTVGSKGYDGFLLAVVRGL